MVRVMVARPQEELIIGVDDRVQCPAHEHKPLWIGPSFGVRRARRRRRRPKRRRRRSPLLRGGSTSALEVRGTSRLPPSPGVSATPTSRSYDKSEVIMKRQAVVVAIAMLVQAPLATAPAEAIPFATSATGLGQSEPLIQQVAVVRAGGARAGGFHGGGVRAGGFHGGGVRA